MILVTFYKIYFEFFFKSLSLDFYFTQWKKTITLLFASLPIFSIVIPPTVCLMWQLRVSKFIKAFSFFMSIKNSFISLPLIQTNCCYHYTHDIITGYSNKLLCRYIKTDVIHMEGIVKKFKTDGSVLRYLFFLQTIFIYKIDYHGDEYISKVSII